MKEATRIAVLLSGKGRGSNMRALVEACRSDSFPAEVILVVSANEDAPALKAAAELGVETLAIPVPVSKEAALFEEPLLQALEERRVDLICLAGLMRKLSPRVLNRYRNRIMNIHPALLPAFGGRGFYGRRVHEEVIECGARYSGVTVHFVDEEYDHGPIVAQAVVPVEDDDTPETLAARILTEEHRLYPDAVRLFAEGRLKVEGRRVRRTPPAQGS